MASASGTPVPAIARLLAAHEDTVRDVIHRFNSNYPNHSVLARDMQAYLRWRNANARHPDVIAAQRRERARIRSKRHQRWGRPRTQAA